MKKLILYALIFAPSPFYWCFDGCLGSSFVLSPAIAWITVLTIPSFLSPLIWLWHLIFMIPFIAVFMPVKKYFDTLQWVKVRKGFALFLVFIGYWLVVALLWSLVPTELTQKLLGQVPWSYDQRSVPVPEG